MHHFQMNSSRLFFSFLLLFCHFYFSSLRFQYYIEPQRFLGVLRSIFIKLKRAHTQESPYIDYISLTLFSFSFFLIKFHSLSKITHFSDNNPTWKPAFVLLVKLKVQSKILKELVTKAVLFNIFLSHFLCKPRVERWIISWM